MPQHLCQYIQPYIVNVKLVAGSIGSQPLFEVMVPLELYLGTMLQGTFATRPLNHRLGTDFFYIVLTFKI